MPRGEIPSQKTSLENIGSSSSEPINCVVKRNEHFKTVF